jgi:trk system potassium uptake protein TrkH
VKAKPEVHLAAAFRLVRGRLTPPQIIALSFFVTILMGWLLLCLPFARAPGQWVGPLDALFVATSAVCVTGLTPVVTAASWSAFGKVVVLCLIQVGGLSITTLFALIVVQMGRKVTLRERLTLQASFNTNDISGMVRMVLLVIRGTLLAETVGAALLTGFFLRRGLGLATSAAYGVFHAVSAFCNAGFDVIGEHSLSPYAAEPFLNLVIAALIALGGIGFVVWRDFYLKIRYFLSPSLKRRIRLSLHARIALLTTALLILAGAACFLACEYANPRTLGQMPPGEKLLAAFFQSVTLRTAGFFTIPQGALSDGSKLVSSLLMLIGGSPGGTAGGIKTVTVAVLLISVGSTLKGEGRFNAFGRSLSRHAVQKALTVTVAMLFLWFAGSAALSVAQLRSAFHPAALDILFEVASALGTVGMTTGITPFLSAASKLILILLMYIGRIGPLTLVVSVAHRTSSANERIQFPNEDVLIG